MTRPISTFGTRRAEPSDAEGIAIAHRDSIRSIGPRFYPDQVVEEWADNLTGDLYVQAMAGGEVFFIAVAQAGGANVILGFASDYRRQGSRHGTSVYVTGASVRLGIGSALLRLAEAEAISKGATSVHVESSLAGVEFYKANGFVEVGRGHTLLMSGRPIDCVFMEKTLA
jgi:GNAT superfamily N-acetyltransferase